jgi:hypothetical protein
MDLSALQENIVPAKLDYRGFAVNLKIRPDADASGKETNGEFLEIKLSDWDITDKGDKVAITLENLTDISKKSPELFAAILKKVLEVVNAPLGK